MLILIIRILLLVIIFVIIKAFCDWCDRPRMATSVNNAVQTQAYIKQACARLENSPLYRTKLATAMARCVAANCQYCRLVCPKDSTNHLAQAGKGVIWDDQLGILFCYVFDRTSSVYGLNDIRYSTVPVSDMAQKLNKSIGNYCMQMGLSSLRIVRQSNLDDAQVCFCLAPFISNGQIDWGAVDNYLDNLNNTDGRW